MHDGAGRGAWRIWAPPLVVILIMMASLSVRADGSLSPPSGVQLIIVFHGALALLWRLRFPLTVTVVAVAAACTLPQVAPHVIATDAASIVALYTLATRRSRKLAWTTGIGAALALTAATIPWQPHGFLDFHTVLPVNYLLAAVAVGDAVRSRQALLAQIRERAEQAERTREQEARHRVQEERVRIARDLHDVVAHHITLVNAQAGVAHHLMPTHPDRAYEALAEIRETSRTALDELRATVGLLRSDDDPPDSRQPTPTFTDLRGLVDGFRKAGFDIVITADGERRPLTGPADVAAYRIVQEALTNAGKHGLPGPVEIHLAYEPAQLRVTVANAARPGHRGAGTGHGLIGMRERAEAVAGTLTADMRADGRFVVEAVLPLRMPQDDQGSSTTSPAG